jgi:hypothetical protein
MFLGLPDPDPSLFCTDPDPSINKQKVGKTLISTIFDFFLTFIYANDVNVTSKNNKEKTLKKTFLAAVLKPEGP